MKTLPQRTGNTKFTNNANLKHSFGKMLAFFGDVTFGGSWTDPMLYSNWLQRVPQYSLIDKPGTVKSNPSGSNFFATGTHLLLLGMPLMLTLFCWYCRGAMNNKELGLWCRRGLLAYVYNGVSEWMNALVAGKWLLYTMAQWPWPSRSDIPFCPSKLSQYWPVL